MYIPHTMKLRIVYGMIHTVSKGCRLVIRQLRSCLEVHKGSDRFISIVRD